MDVPRKFVILRVVALLLKLLAWIVLIFSVAVAVLWFPTGGGQTFAGLKIDALNYLGIFQLPLGIISFLQLFVAGSLISATVDAEHNARKSATVVEQMAQLNQQMQTKLAAMERQTDSATMKLQQIEDKMTVPMPIVTPPQA